MEVFDALKRNRHENLMFFQHRESGLKGVLAIHDSTLGPALGGVRCWDYQTEDHLIRDALRLAENASLSAALFGCDAGGGKAVIWCDPRKLSETMLRALGIFLHSLGGRFIASPDLGTSARDMEVIAKETPFVAGKSGTGSSDLDYSAITARGVFLGMKAAAKSIFGSAVLKGRKIAIQGLGKVGSALMTMLVEEGAELFVSDLYFERVKAAKDKNPACVMISPDEIPFVPVDIFAPCAMGDLFDADSIKKLRCRIIAGAATNQPASEDIVSEIERLGIIFLPDFLLNAGDIIMVNAEIYDVQPENCLSEIEKVYGLVENLLIKSKSRGKTPYATAKEWAIERMKRIRTLKKLYRTKL